MNNKYIISPVTTYNFDEQLFETKIGLSGSDMPLHYLVYGNSKEISRLRANQLIDLLNSVIAVHH